MSEQEQTILDRIKKYHIVITLVGTVIGAIASPLITMFMFSVNYGRSLEQREQQSLKVAVHEMRLDNQDTALANHRAIIYGNVFARDNTRIRSYRESRQ